MRSSPYLTLRLLEDFAKRENVTKHYFRLKKMMSADPEQLRARQWKALQALLTHAYLHVPFYRERFDSQGLQPEDIRSFEDFAAFPALSRQDIQKRSRDLLSDTADPDSLRIGNSSGSTGQRITFYHSREAYSAGRAAVLAGWEMAGKKLGDRFTTLWGNRPVVEQQWTKPGSRLKAGLYGNTRIPAYRLTDENKIENALKTIKKQKGGFLQGYSSGLYGLALYAKKHGIRFEPKFDGVLTTAETLFPHQRRLIEEIFGPVYDGYGCNEILGIAYQCRCRQGYHVVEPNVIFETQDFNGDIKEIVVTDLWNYAFPLIRYRVGDLAYGELSPGTCGCTWRTIERIEGRTTDIINTPEGGILSASAFGFRELKTFCPPIEQYQLAKVGPEKVVIRLQIENGKNVDFEKIKSLLEPYYRDLFEYEIERVDKFALEQSGKHKVIVDETV